MTPGTSSVCNSPLKRDLCIFCYKSVDLCDESRKNNGDPILKKFVKFVDRYLGKVNPDKASASSDILKLLGCCRDCGSIVDAFCDLYHQLKCIELKLEWRLDTLVKVMRLANKVPSRIKQLRDVCNGVLDGEPDEGAGEDTARRRLKAVKSFRAEFQGKCARRRLTSMPRVLLHRQKTPTSNPIPASGANLKQEDISSTSTDEQVPAMPMSPNTASGLFLGWTMSLSAVSLLASTTANTASNGRMVLESCSEPDSIDVEVNDEYDVPSPPPNEVDINSENEDVEPIEIEESDTIKEEESWKNVDPLEPYCENKSFQIPMVLPADEEPSVANDNNILFSHHETLIQDDIMSDVAGQQEDLLDPLGVDLEETENTNASEIDQMEDVEDKSALLPIIANITGDRENQPLPTDQLPTPSSPNELAGNACPKRTITIDICRRSTRLRKRVYNCSACKMWFPTYERLRQHKRTKRHLLLLNILKKKVNSNADEFSPALDHEACSESGATNERTCQSRKLAERRFAFKKKKKGTSMDIKPKWFECTLDTCKYRTHIQQNFEDHNKLHEPGEFKCHFCDMTESSVIRLANHEQRLHQTDVADVGSQLAIFYCPRPECTYEALKADTYYWHFANVHVGGFEKTRRGKFVKCKICKQDVREYQQDDHFKRNHDKTGVQDKDIWNCQGCSAYFKTRDQYRYHRKHIHFKSTVYQNPLKTTKKQENVKTPSFHCEFCDKKFRYVRRLDNHKRKYHKKQTGKIVEPQLERETLAESAEVTPPPSPSMEEEEEEHIEDMTSSTPKRYNLRQSRQLSYQNMDEDVDMEEKDESFGVPETESPASDTEDESSLESDSSNSSHSECDSEVEIATPRKYYENRFECTSEGCNYRTQSAAYLEEHLTLHGPGKYKCNFCDDIEESVIELLRHERNQHSSTEKLDRFLCPRCPYEATVMSYFEWHFAEVHIGGFQRSRKVKCEICMATVQRGRADTHFQEYHDTSGLDETEIWRCDLENCSAYFLKEDQRSSHIKKVHDIRTTKSRSECSKRPCDICKSNILKGQEKLHFEWLHDTEGMEEDSIPKCDVEGCSAYFRKTHQLRKHQRRIHAHEFKEIDNDKVDRKCFKCKMCDQKFAYPYHLLRHQRIFHKEVKPEEAPPKTPSNSFFICPEVNCAKKVRSLKDLETHRKLHGSFKCNFCDTTKDYAPDLALHESEHAVRPPSKDFTDKEFINCPRCSESYERRGHYIRHHLETHMDLTNAGFTCPICKAEGFYYRFIARHFKTHHKTDGMDPSKISKCDLCPAYFIRGNQLVVHKVKVHTEKKNTCPECGKVFSNFNLRGHMEKAHPHFLPSLKFACDIPDCTKRFGTERELASHKRTHAKVRQGMVKCPECSKECKGDARLKAHVQIVHCIPSHVCPECGKAFKTKIALNTHMEYHKGPDAWKFQCSECGRKFVTKQKMEEHLRTHTKEKPFVCQYCGNKYAHRHNWRYHVKAAHGDEEDVEQDVGGALKGNFLSRKGSKKGECITAGVVQK